MCRCQKHGTRIVAESSRNRRRRLRTYRTEEARADLPGSGEETLLGPSAVAEMVFSSVPCIDDTSDEMASLFSSR